MKLRAILHWVLIPTGLGVAFYGVSLVMGLDSMRFDKFSTDAVDTATALLVVLFGIALALYGLFGSSLIGQQKKRGN